jgi:ribosomal protein S18 acetylase RimI-like enzyme
MVDFEILALADEHRADATALLTARWGTTQVVSRGVLHDLVDYPGIVAVQNGAIIGLLTYHIQGDHCEITSLDSLHENAGIGSALITAARAMAQAAGCRRLWLITTNDNLRTIGFYQKRGFELVAVHRRALDDSRRLKPQIPLIGLHGIPLRDEIEFEMWLD